MANNNLTITQDENGVVRVCRVVLEPVREFATVLEACEFVGEELRVVRGQVHRWSRDRNVARQHYGQAPALYSRRCVNVTI